MSHGVPVGWCRIGLRLQVHQGGSKDPLKALAAAAEGHVAYYSVCPSAVALSVLQSRLLPRCVDTPLQLSSKLMLDSEGESDGTDASSTSSADVAARHRHRHRHRDRGMHHLATALSKAYSRLDSVSDCLPALQAKRAAALAHAAGAAVPLALAAMGVGGLQHAAALHGSPGSCLLVPVQQKKARPRKSNAKAKQRGHHADDVWGTCEQAQLKPRHPFDVAQAGVREMAFQEGVTNPVGTTVFDPPSLRFVSPSVRYASDPGHLHSTTWRGCRAHTLLVTLQQPRGYRVLCNATRGCVPIQAFAAMRSGKPAAASSARLDDAVPNTSLEWIVDPQWAGSSESTDGGKQVGESESVYHPAPRVLLWGILVKLEAATVATPVGSPQQQQQQQKRVQIHTY